MQGQHAKYICTINSGIKLQKEGWHTNCPREKSLPWKALCVFTWGHGALSLAQPWKQFTDYLCALLSLPLNPRVF